MEKLVFLPDLPRNILFLSRTFDLKDRLCFYSYQREIDDSFLTEEQKNKYKLLIFIQFIMNITGRNTLS